jgi:catechol 2,3-dioxygenase-like lactoylglutathione lyase family enzyme
MTAPIAQRIAHIALVVKDYDEAIRFYTEKLNFIIIEDTVLTDSKRWVLIAPPGAKECCLLLAKAVNERQKASIGNQTGGRVFLFLYTNNFENDYKQMVENGIRFIRQPAKEAYGTVAVFEDLYGNLWDLIEPNDQTKGLICKKKM